MPLFPMNWGPVRTRLRSHPGIALFLDFDGTLSPLVDDPAQARVDYATRGALARLAGNPRARVCIISGRRGGDLRARIALPGLRYLGVHGADTSTVASGPPVFAPEVLSRVSRTRRDLIASLNGAAGVQVEDKNISFALHYRRADPETAERAGHLLQKIVAQSGGRLRMEHGNRVWEVLPVENRGKGYAAWKQWRAWGAETLPVYVGNDATDEAAFETLATGVTVCVGPARPSKARYSLRNTTEVRWFLIQLEKEMPWGTPPGSNS